MGMQYIIGRLVAVCCRLSLVVGGVVGGGASCELGASVPCLSLTNI